MCQVYGLFVCLLLIYFLFFYICFIVCLLYIGFPQNNQFFQTFAHLYGMKRNQFFLRIFLRSFYAKHDIFKQIDNNLIVSARSDNKRFFQKFTCKQNYDYATLNWLLLVTKTSN